MVFRWRWAARVAAAVAAAVGVSAAAAVTVDGVAGKPKPAAGPSRLTSFGTCAWQADYFRSATIARLNKCGYFILTGSSPRLGCERSRRGRIVSGGGGETGATNVQVEGVDEADILKGNATVQYLLVEGVVHVLGVIRGGASATRLGQVDVGPALGMLADGSRLLVVGQPSYGDEGVETTRLTRVDASRPHSPVVTSTLTLDGRVRTSRSIDGTATLIVSYNTQLRLNSLHRMVMSRWRRAKEARVEDPKTMFEAALKATTDSFWVPGYILRLRQGGKDTIAAQGPLAACARTYRPSGFGGYFLLSVLRVAIGEDAPISGGDGGPAPRGVAIVSEGGTVYASNTSLFVTSTKHEKWYRRTTTVNMFDISRASATYVASGSVPGRLLNHFALHEHNGTLFVATTESGRWVEESSIIALTPRSPCAACHRRLAVVGRLGSLGVGERIYAVRYIANMAYVVTFRDWDPLYAISLANPSRMVNLGELKVPGFSNYLHLLSPTLLLGLGRNVSPQGEPRTAKASLFSVPSGGGVARAAGAPPPTQLAELATWSGPPQWSMFDVVDNHHAFAWWPARSLVIAPLTNYNGGGSFVSFAVILRVGRGGTSLTEVRRIDHRTFAARPSGFIPKIVRVLVVRGRYLWTISSKGVAVHDLDTFSRTSRTAIS
ncbi:hypothetical protein MMPV_002713 [Pyropia vietnamensis]